MSIYLDYNASAPIKSEVLQRMISVYKDFPGNADSRTHDYGTNTRAIVEDSRKEVASILGVLPEEVFFTSGATESNNIVLQGLEEYAKANQKLHIVTTSIEHKAILETAKQLERRGYSVTYINPDSDGAINFKDVIKAVRDDTLLVSVMHVNNETGIIQPVKEIADYLQNKDVYFHIDATQSFGKLVPELQQLQYDMLSMSAHKIGGPQGVGALVLRKRNYKYPPVKPIMFGGQQERGLRPGTIPVALVAGLGEACRIAKERYVENHKKILEIKDTIIDLLQTSGIPYMVNGNINNSVNSTLNICFPGVSSEALMLSTKQYCGISNGSACNTLSYKPSYVLTAMGLSTERIESSVRISWGPESDVSQIRDEFLQLLEIAKLLMPSV